MNRLLVAFRNPRARAVAFASEACRQRFRSLAGAPPRGASPSQHLREEQGNPR